MPDQVPPSLKLLGNGLRWQILRLLALSDMRVSELVAATGASANQVSYHLGQLRTVRLVSERRSNHDSREVYYRLNVGQLRLLLKEATDSLHPALYGMDEPEAPGELLQQPVRLLFLCTHNSARSQMAEGLARHLGAGQVEAFSAGTEVTYVRSEAVLTMKRRGIDITHHEAKHLDRFHDQHFDYVITVCDSVREECPLLPGDHQRVHWSFPDPCQEQDPERRREAFEYIARQLEERVRYLLLMIAHRQRA